MTSALPRSDAALAVLALALLGACQDYTISGGLPNVDPSQITECGFTPIPGTKLSRYDCNPVFSKANLKGDANLGSTSFLATDVMGHPFYQMWYVRYPKSGNPAYQLDYAISSDGVTWEDHPDNPGQLEPTPGEWDRDDMQGVRVVWDPAERRYVFTYQGVKVQGLNSQVKLGAYESSDGLDWSPTTPTALLDLGQPQGGIQYCWPLSLTRPNADVFAGFIAGGKVDLTGLGASCDIYRFSATDIDDADTFAVEPKPVLTGGPKAYDKQGALDAAVVKFDDTWYLFYVGFQRWTQNPGTNLISASQPSLAMARSSDGVNWEKNPDNPLPIEAAVSNRVSNVAAQVVGSRVHLWITDYYEKDANGGDLNDLGVGYFLFEPDIAPHPAE